MAAAMSLTPFMHSPPLPQDIPLTMSELVLNGIKTERLHLRQWNDGDIDAIHSIMQDPNVNYYLQKYQLNLRPTIEAIAAKSELTLPEKGYGYFVCVHKETKAVISLMGLNYTEIEAQYFPCYTVSWVLKKDCWGKGYAKEAATALMEYGFNTLQIPEIFSCTTWNNKASEKVMQSLKMEYKTSFNFPGFEQDDIFCNHILYVKNNPRNGRFNKC